MSEFVHDEQPRSARPSTAFIGSRKLCSGTLAVVAIAVKEVNDSDTCETVLVFDDATGCVIDLDLRGDAAEIVARLDIPVPQPIGRYRSRAQDMSRVSNPSPGPGRPKLGVVAREVTLLPRQWAR